MTESIISYLCEDQNVEMDPRRGRQSSRARILVGAGRRAPSHTWCVFATYLS